MVIPPFYLAVFYDQGSGRITGIQIETGELLMDGERVSDAIIMRNDEIRTPGYLSLLSDHDAEFQLRLDGADTPMGEIADFVNAGGKITLVEHDSEGAEHRHDLEVSEVFASEPEWIKQKALAG